MKTAEELKKDIEFECLSQGNPCKFTSTWGLFSPRAIDVGSRLLLDHIKIADGQTTLDLGCGYGVLGLSIAKNTPNGSVHLVDKDFVAIEYTKKNIALNNLTNCQAYLSNALNQVADIQFDNIVSNLPAKVGKELLYIIQADAHRHLKPHGQFVVVTILGLKKFIKRNFLETFGNYKKLKQGKDYVVARAIKD